MKFFEENFNFSLTHHQKEKDASALIQALKDINLKKRYFKLRLQYQQDHANETTIEAFNQIFKA
ncbi:hypothetical protein [Staphylococcus pseudintermedius]|uniref:hypothetical protein n=1 Tax=Staphylococcus pseudintermedius TaxID=283734 RepID=UPI001F5B8630|nr:hypothetical protein [Staphylococcus pseudintermedius]